MPTGSLCAERNVIGTALGKKAMDSNDIVELSVLLKYRSLVVFYQADNPSLKRQDLKMIACLAIPYPKQIDSSTKSFGRQRVQSSNSIASLVTTTSEDEGSIGKPPFIPSRKSSLGEEEEWTVQTPSSLPSHQQQKNMTNLDKKGLHVGPANPEMLHYCNTSIDSTPSPARTIYLYNKPQRLSRKSRRAIVVSSNAVGCLFARLYFWL